MEKELFAFIKKCPTAYHTVAECAARLVREGYKELPEGKNFEVTPGEKYFVTRNGSSLVAFRTPLGDFSGFMIAAVHGDAPSYQLRQRPELCGKYRRLAVEPYGGAVAASWMDLPLSVAGRVTVREGDGFCVKNVDFGTPFLMIPRVAPHLAGNGTEGADPAVDLLPLMGTANTESFEERLSRVAGVPTENIFSTDLFLYNPADGVRFGDLIAAPRLDDLQCVFAALTAFLSSENRETGCGFPVFALFDNEEVGSATKQGAASTFLSDVLERVLSALWMDGAEYRRKLATSMMVSCDNAHAVHPNHPEYSDRVEAPLPNGGVVIKRNANQRYTTDAVSAALFSLIAARAEVPVQYYSNRADLRGGSTLGSISSTKVSLHTVDVGLAQLAMHSATETAGAADTDYLVRALRVFFESGIRVSGSSYTLVL